MKTWTFWRAKCNDGGKVKRNSGGTLERFVVKLVHKITKHKYVHYFTMIALTVPSTDGNIP
jgi:hypothetical protein